MHDEKSTVANETDCEVTINDGSWMTCNMITDDETADTEDDPESQGLEAKSLSLEGVGKTGSKCENCRSQR